MENRRKRKFQGMQWIFLKDERRSERNNLSMLESMVSQLEESLENDFEDFPIVITRNSMA